MPRYFFHNSERDEVGIELTDDEAAREIAKSTFGEFIRDLPVSDAAATSHHMRVVAEDGRQVCTLSFLVAR